MSSDLPAHVALVLLALVIALFVRSHYEPPETQTLDDTERQERRVDHVGVD